MFMTMQWDLKWVMIQINQKEKKYSVDECNYLSFKKAN
jgi:hypothetical protein